MITLTGINKRHGNQILFVDGSLQQNPGEKVGLTGPNGAGKSLQLHPGRARRQRQAPLSQLPTAVRECDRRVAGVVAAAATLVDTRRTRESSSPSSSQ
jgi:ATPase subunit of ABC transporter with duplicated ATPase domains